MEIPNAAAVALFNSLEKHKLDKNLLIAGTGLNIDYMSDPKKKHTWDQFVKMYSNCAEYLGEEVTAQEIGYYGIYNENLSLVRKVATSLLNIKTIYWYTATFVAKYFFKECVTFHYTNISTKKIKMEIKIHPEMQDCPLLLKTYVQLFEILPTLLGLPKAKVTSEISERSGVYVINFQHTYFLKLITMRIRKVFENDDNIIQLISELETQSIELSKVVDEKSQLLRIVSHDIANQVSIIDYYINKTLKHEELTEMGSKNLNIAKNSSHKLYNILKNVQNLEISSTKGIQLVPVDVESLFLSIADQFETQIKHKNLTLRCRNEIGYTASVMAEVNTLETNVIGNLLTNAIKFSPEGSVIELLAEMSGDKILISVIDQGLGIPLEERQGLFTKKIRKSRFGTLGERGTGFGLGIVSNYVKLFGGKISVYSNTPQGSKFVIELQAYMPQNVLNNLSLDDKDLKLNPRNLA